MNKFRVLDLFSGIGGFSLGLERTGGFETVAFCEIEEFPRRVLAKHWPKVPCYHDVRELTAARLAADGIAVDVICGGFPCQDISLAGKGAGIAEGTRSGLWSEIARISSELRPQFVIVENVAALLGRGLDRVLGDLASIGYDAEWHCIPASAIGAPHRRDRFWLVAHPSCAREAKRQEHSRRLRFDFGRRFDGTLPDAAGERCGEAGELRHEQPEERSAGLCEEMADAHDDDVQGVIPSLTDTEERSGQIERPAGSRGHGLGWWAVEPDVGRVAHGVPSRVDRLKALGNAVVPQIPELIGRAILESRRAA